MEVVIVNCFDTYEDRIDLLYEFFCKKGFNVTIIQSDFRHFKKVKRTDKKAGYILIKSKPYYKNMSVKRLISHYAFAKKAFKLVEKIEPNLLYAIIPPNSVTKFAAEYKKNHKDVKLIFDLIDLWPETMPIGKIKSFAPFTFWRLLRDKYLNSADFIITECNLYQSILENVIKGIRTRTVYLAKKEINTTNNSMLDNNEIHLCYLGSINNIIDISKIKELIKLLHEIKPTTLHIIGDGENKNVLINEINFTGANVEYHGKIYDPQKKQDIFDKCHFGLNIMKINVCVGLTMKSIDYIQHGLPIINNIQADTMEIVNDYNIGINIVNDNVADVVEKIVNTEVDTLEKMRENTHKIFGELFSVQAFEEKLNTVIKEL